MRTKVIVVKDDAVGKEEAGEDIGDGDDGDVEDDDEEECMRMPTVGRPLDSCLQTMQELTEVQIIDIIFLAPD